MRIVVKISVKEVRVVKVVPQELKEQQAHKVLRVVVPQELKAHKEQQAHKVLRVL
jgi:hypothetical protein